MRTKYKITVIYKDKPRAKESITSWYVADESKAASAVARNLTYKETVKAFYTKETLSDEACI